MSSSIGNCMHCSECNQEKGYICSLDGNFYSTGEYSRTVDFFQIHGVSFNQKIDSVKHLLDYNTLQILKVLLQENDSPANLNLEDSLNVVATLDIIQSRLSDDNKTESNPKVQYDSVNSYHRR